VYNPSFKKRVAVLRGGPSDEYDVSMQTGAGVLRALSDSPFETQDIVISKKGEWLSRGFVKTPEQALLNSDVVFIALHGAYGEDGTVQRILERLSLPFTGSNSFASAIAINKALTKDHLKKHSTSILMPPHMKLSKQESPNLIQHVATIKELFGPEYVIKPIGGGSSIGTVLTNQYDLYKNIVAALEQYDEILVEKRIQGKEATVGVIENYREKKYYSLPAIEIVPPSSAQFFSADVKYTGETEEICPGRFTRDEKEELMNAAKLVHEILGLAQYSRSDFVVANDGVYFLEVNTLPGLTTESLFPKSIEAVGGSYKELVTHLISTASR